MPFLAAMHRSLGTLVKHECASTSRVIGHYVLLVG